MANDRARDWAAIFGVLAAFLALGVSAYTYYRGAPMRKLKQKRLVFYNSIGS